MKAAVMSCGHITTGVHHGDAFSQLTEKEKEVCDIISGHVNEDGTFTTDLPHDNKELILIRHAESEYNAGISDNLDSCLTELGNWQSVQLARFLKEIDLDGFGCWVSPYARCLETAEYLDFLKFEVRVELREYDPKFAESCVLLRNHREKFPQFEWTWRKNYLAFCEEGPKNFLKRMREVFIGLPNKAVVVAHGGVVLALMEIAMGVEVETIPVWSSQIGNASITYVKDGTILWMARKC